MARRRSQDPLTLITHSTSYSANGILVLVALALTAGAAATYFLPKYQPELYKIFNNTFAGFPDQINKWINSFHGQAYYTYPYMPVNTVHAYYDDQ